MGLRFQILGTSSSGNCALLESPQTRILLDAGFSGRRLEALLKQIRKPIESIDAVFLTHEHSDHTAGLRGLAKYPHLKFFANYPTARIAQSKLNRELSWKIFETGSSFTYKDLEVETLLLPHDAMEPVGFVIRNGGEDLFNPRESIAWVTDLGHVPARLADRIRDVELLILEANYDPLMLELDHKRPQGVKQRIMGRHGHLSNSEACAFLRSVDSPRWRKVLLAHLSKDCNHPSKVMESVNQSGFCCSIDCLDPEQLIFPEIELAKL